MSACDPKYLHSPKPPDMTFWPYDVPSIMDRIERSGLEINATRTLDGMQSRIDEITERWRCAVLWNIEFKIELRSYLFDNRIPTSIRESSRKLLARS